jgi:N-acetylglucosaminyl-diphospho-decaprenol L-rhamnosyltransferase
VTGADPAVSVIVVSYNTRELLLACLTSLSQATLPLQVIVVDNASTDGSAEAARAHAKVLAPAPGPHTTLPEGERMQVIANADNLGFSKANNLGLAAARAPYVLVLNSDAAVRAGTIEALVQVLESRPEVGIVGPRTRGADGRIQVSFGPDLTVWNEWRQRRLVHGVKRGEPSALRRAEALASAERDVPWVSGSCLLARRELLARLGGFDEGFFLYEEDVDLCVRARRAGFQVRFTPRAEIVHHLGRSMETASERARQAYRESHRRFYDKHHGPIQRALLRLWMLLK